VVEKSELKTFLHFRDDGTPIYKMVESPTLIADAAIWRRLLCWWRGHAWEDNTDHPEPIGRQECRRCLKRRYLMLNLKTGRSHWQEGIEING
jgi:hypothetical protein